MRSRYHGSKISGSQQNCGPSNMAEKQKQRRKWRLTFLCMIALRNKTVVHTFVHRSTMQMIDRLGQENIVGAKNFATTATWRHTSPLYYHAVWLLDRSNYLFLTISNTESAIGVTERSKISMHGNKNMIMLSNFQIFRSDWMLGWES